jgi:hypothetical protein
MATTLSTASMNFHVDGVQVNTYPLITLAQPEKILLKVDHARTPLLSVLLTPVITTPVSPNVYRALSPPMLKWTFINSRPLVFLTGGLFQYFGCVISFVTILM